MSERTYPDKLEVKPLERPPNATVRVPGSKSITNRALVLAALTHYGKGCSLSGAVRCEDTEVMTASLRQLGFRVDADWDNERVLVAAPDPHEHGLDYPFESESADLYVANSGTTMRFLTALVSLGKGRFRIDGTKRMKERPIEDLLAALRQLGVKAKSESGNGCPPVIVESDGWWTAGPVKISADVSSQFLSALLLAAPRSLSFSGTTIVVNGPLVSEPYVTMTLEMMREFGFDVEQRSAGEFWIPSRQGTIYDLTTFQVEPDASGASYFFGVPAITGGHVTVPGLSSRSLQGDIRFTDAMQMMGCRVERGDAQTSVTSNRRPTGIDIDMNAISDTVMTLAAVACFAEGPTTIRNVAHIRHKETDRLAALATELRRLGAEVDEFADGLTITPRPLHGAEIETYNDHRMAMSMALIGLKVPGVVIKNPGCVAKTYPGFWEDLEKLRT
jgi:3-phosphoshikimate 1-carboxyvinyltransferase